MSVNILVQTLAGGQEAKALFAYLIKQYRNKYKARVIMQIKLNNFCFYWLDTIKAYQVVKQEHGIHKLARMVPEEGRDQIHMSTCLVLVTKSPMPSHRYTSID